jgi:cation:H+ antiporter
MPSIGRFHSASLLIAVVYMITFRLVYLDRRVSRPRDVSDDEEVPAVPVPVKGWQRPIAWYLGSTLGIFLLAPFLASSSIQLSDVLHLSGTFFGAVFLALVTSLPELVTTGEASRMGAEDMAIGNVLGSNAFNLLILVGVDICYPQPLFSSLTSVHAIAALGIIATTTVAAMGLLYRAEKRFLLLEPDAVSIVLMAILFFYLLYVL